MEVLMSADAAGSTVRRPRMTQARRLELLNVVLDVLSEVGYEALSMDVVASRARCSKATLYRLWPGKPQLVAAALYDTRPIRVEEIDTGTLRGDLLTMVGVFGSYEDRATALFAALGHAVLVDEELAVAVRTSMLDPWCAELIEVVDRAVERRELPVRPAAADLLPQLLLSAVVTRRMFEGGRADTDYLTRCVDDVLLPALLHS
jgi:AcrR family transcriptional regulator